MLQPLFLFRLSGFCISRASLYFLGKYEVVAIVDVWSNNDSCSVLMLYSDNADYVACFNLTSR